MTSAGFEFAALYLELVDSTHMIRTLLAGIQSDEARLRPDPSSWSVLETVCHLCDEERLDFRPRLDGILHHPEQEWAPIDPEGWVLKRKYNEQKLEDVKSTFFEEREKSLDWLKGLEHSDWSVAHMTEAGPIRAGDMLAAWVAHDNLAARQLVELRRSRLERMANPYSLEYAGTW